MDTRLLRVLVELERRGTLRAVAEATGYGTSAVSQQLATLERDVGATLVEPDGRRLRLTPAGELLADHGRRILAAVAEARAALDPLSEPSGTLRIAAFAGALSRDLLPVARRLAASHPSLRLLLSEHEPDEVFELLDSGRIELGFVYDYNLVPWAGREPTELLCDTPLVLAVPASLADAYGAAGDQWLSTDAAPDGAPGTASGASTPLGGTPGGRPFEARAPISDAPARAASGADAPVGPPGRASSGAAGPAIEAGAALTSGAGSSVNGEAGATPISEAGASPSGGAGATLPGGAGATPNGEAGASANGGAGATLPGGTGTTPNGGAGASANGGTGASASGGAGAALNGVPFGAAPGKGAPFLDALARWAGTPWVVNSRSRADDELAARVCALAGFTPVVAHRADSLELVLDIVESELGVALVPAFLPSRPGVRLLPLHGLDVRRRMYAVTRPGGWRWPGVRLVVDQVIAGI
ncbi:LysR family transcriptional regulator [Nonomuraea soli]|uniref:DNA-binding transcriptional LysR family regulator n=1 Tax=Nonomuraea soli TaxID=1032476 RepID=A0A7W0HUM3_9ACTN|nr:LysR substrate-binding domain-containing protein [Nonomuraea soli]MBA2896334.1 DNA-binding transcriptional LysR family regulator [Nonomuraea soli]